MYPAPSARRRRWRGALATKREGTPSDEIWHPEKMKSTEYEETLRALQIELVKAQYWAKNSGNRIVIVFEG
ncbi:MAG: hypothetical protein DYH08_18260, partial [Actinobacteria bacterium ATB1]|nr:hypothetical protein [Actinobacteria bacterium ATB1]